jgi:hypothetical protein
MIESLSSSSTALTETNIMTIQIEDNECFDLLLQYVYSDDIELNENNVISLLYNSKKYMIESLIDMCTDYLNRLIDESDEEKLMTIYDQCILFDAKELSDKCIRGMKKIFSNKQCFIGLSKASVKSLLKSDLVTASEVDLFTAAVEWAKTHRTEETFEQSFHSFKKYIRFPLMTPSDLANVVFPTNVLQESELLHLFIYKERTNVEPITNTLNIPFVCTPRRSGIGIYVQRINMKELLNDGWSIVYQHDYTHSTTSNELNQILNNTCGYTQLCVAAKRIDSNILELAAIDSLECMNMTKSKSEAVKSKTADNLYWYHVEGHSFGFSDTPNISLSSADTMSGERRLSWHVEGTGGYRIGDKKDLNYAKDWQKIVFAK